MPPDTIAVLAEKPAVARDIARVLGASQREEGCLRGNGYVVTWAIGHLVELAQPHEINPEWKRWRRDHLDLRLVVGPDHALVLPASALGGATLMVLADLLARTLAAPAEIPLGSLTALIGCPYFLWLLRRTHVLRGRWA